MLSINPLLARLFPKLAYQLVPAAVVTTVGVLLLSNLAKAPDITTDAAPVEAAINAEAVFRIVPRETAETVASPDAEREAKRVKAAASQPKPLPANTVTPQSRKPGDPAAPRQVASAPVAPPIMLGPEQPQAVAVQPPGSENTVMSKLLSATTAVQQMPQRAARSVAGWFSESAPPRPPAPVPVQNFQASM